MSTPRLSRVITRILATALLVAVPSLASFVAPAGADTVSDLQQQQQAALQQAAEAKKQADAQKTLAQRAADSVQRLSGQISSVNQALTGTQQQIEGTQAQIAQKDQDIAKLESDLRSISDQQNALIRQLYISSVSQSDDLALFSSQPTAQRQQQEQEFSALKRSVAALYAKTQAAKAEVQLAKDDLERQNTALSSLKSQQQSQQQTLADAQSTQQALQDNAETAQQQLEAKAAAAQAKATQLGQKIQSLLAQNWGGSPTGNRLIPVADYGWYYSQRDPSWASDTMGYSRYTVGDFGCLITSMAMLEKRAGNGSITPQYIADHGNFDSEGYYWNGPGSLREATYGVSWSYINGQLAAGNPVIVRLNLSSYYTHFVIIYAKSGSNYLIQDPWSPSGSGYSTSLVSGYGVVSGL